MKKLLSLLSISVITSSISTSVVSCSTKVAKNSNKKIDISKKSFKETTNDNINTGADLLTEVQTQMASWVNTNVKNIQNDKNITIVMETSYGNMVKSTTIINSGKYKINIKVSKQDSYFEEVNSTLYIDVTSKDISKKEFKNITTNIYNGKNEINIPISYSGLLNDIQTQIASWAVPGTTLTDIANDSNITITLKDSSGKIVNADTTTNLSAQTYTVTITIFTGDKYFDAQSATNYNIILGTSDISKASFDNFTFYSSDVNGINILYASDLFDNIYEQLGKLANTSKENIMSDNNIRIMVKDSSGKEINPGTTTSISAQTYTVNITVTVLDKYFSSQSGINYNLNVNLNNLSAIDISKNRFIDTSLNAVKTGYDLLTNIQTQMATWSNISLKNIQNDKNIKIVLTDASGKIVNPDKTTNLSANVKPYTINITIANGDWYFVAQNNIKYNIIVSLSNINNNKFTAVSLNDVKTGAELLKNIETQMATWAVPTVTQTDINNEVNSKAIIIEIIDPKGKIVNADTTLTVQKDYQINIKITDKDKYFAQNSKTHMIDVNN